MKTFGAIFLCAFLFACSGNKNPSGNGPNGSDGRHSDLPILFSCIQPALHSCYEYYSDFEPATAPQCGLGSATRDAACPEEQDFLGACRTAVQGTSGFHVQTVTFYYTGSAYGNDPALVEKGCRDANGEYLAN
jgi:hypothetical protein